jgi:hypothetical protein
MFRGTMAGWGALHRAPAALVVVARTPRPLLAPGLSVQVVGMAAMHLACAAAVGAEIRRTVEDAPSWWRCHHCREPIAPNALN